MNLWKTVYRKYLRNFIGISAVVALIINLMIETLASQNLFGGILFVIQKPVVFFLNSLIIFGWISLAMLFRRKLFAFTLLCISWLVLGIVNGIILSNRMTPFTTYDLLEMKDALSLATTYFSKAQIVFMIVGGGMVLLVIGILFKKLPKQLEKVNYRRAVTTVLLILVIAFGGIFLGIKGKALETFFPNLAYGYEDNGVAYCFLATWLDKGVDRPADYSQQQIDGIFTQEEKNRLFSSSPVEAPEDSPNIIFLQLESFMDPQTVKDVSLSQDAIPFYRTLMEQYSSGRLEVPSVGAGTANTEFEAMSGMSVKFFGPGEYPYKSVLHDKTSETIPYNLKDLGYATHAIHNHRGVFYGRNIVFRHLGFDTFTSLEYMNNVSKTPKNWARDNVLTTQITNALKSTPEKDYIYTISVQGHGRYPTNELLENPLITVTDAPSEELRWAWEYYANQIKEMDVFVENLVEELNQYDEKVVLVMYGDHLPALSNLTDDNLKGGRSAYQTDYVIWSNYPMEEKDQDLFAYQIGAEVLDQVDIHHGTLVAYQQNHRNDKQYRENLNALQYDMLYGEQYIYGQKNPFQPTDMHMGIKEIKITDVIEISGKYYIKGENFTTYSKINLDGKILNTSYLGPTVLGVEEEVDPDDVDKMKVSQVERDHEILSTTE